MDELVKANHKHAIEIQAYEMKRAGLVALYRHACFMGDNRESESIRLHISAIDDHIFDHIQQQMSNLKRMQQI